jgi:hypothetical protein
VYVELSETTDDAECSLISMVIVRSESVSNPDRRVRSDSQVGMLAPMFSSRVRNLNTTAPVVLARATYPKSKTKIVG